MARVRPRALVSILTFCAVSASTLIAAPSQPAAETAPQRDAPAAGSVEAGVEPSAGTSAAASPPSAPAEAAGDSMVVAKKLTAVRFNGNTVIGSADLEDIAKPYLGKPLTLGQVQEITDKVKDKYHAKGYIMAKAVAPDQDPDAQGGALNIEVFEGKFGKITVDGNKHYSWKFIERFFAPATKGGLIRERPLHRSLLVLREFSDLLVSADFKASETPGATDVTLVVKDAKPFHFGFDYNNFGNIFVGENRAGASIWAGSLLLDGDELFAKVTEPFPTKSDPFLQTTYQAPVGYRGDRVSFSFADAATVVGGQFAQLDLRGEAQIYALNWIHAITRTPFDVATLTSGFVSKSVKNFFLGNQLTSQDELRLLTMTLEGSTRRGRGRTLYNATLTQGLGTAFGGSSNTQGGTSRVGAGNEFTKINGEAYHILQLDRQQFLLFRANAQAASDPLTNAEQYSIGGADSVRGYLQSEFLGDEGFALSGEYRRSLVTKPDFGLQGVAFIDFAHASLINPQVGEIARQSLTGLGVGARASFAKYYSLRLDLGVPLDRNNIKNEDPILYAQFISRF